jgi:hypothetical protein
MGTTIRWLHLTDLPARMNGQEWSREQPLGQLVLLGQP